MGADGVEGGRLGFNDQLLSSHPGDAGGQPFNALCCLRLLLLSLPA